MCFNSMKDLFAWPEAGFVPEEKMVQNNYTCCAVYDGHGGRLASEFCRCVVELSVACVRLCITLHACVHMHAHTHT